MTQRQPKKFDLSSSASNANVNKAPKKSVQPVALCSNFTYNDQQQSLIHPNDACDELMA